MSQAPTEPVPIPRLLERRADEIGDRDLLRFQGGRITYAQAAERAARAAGGFRRLGVGREDRVAVMLGNRPEWIEAWWGLAWLGAIEVPVNPAYLGDPLVHQLNDCEAELMVVEAHLLPRLAEVWDRLRCLRRMVVLGRHDPLPQGGGEVQPWSVLTEGPAAPRAEVEAWDVAAIMYTSGTTGPAKGVICPWGHVYSNSNSPVQAALLAGPGVLQMCLPMNHIGGQWFGLAGCLIASATLSLVPRFTASDFWPQAREAEATCALLIGAMANFLLEQPAGPADRDHGIRRVLCTPAPARFDDFERRFGVRLSVSYGLTEGSTPIGTPTPDDPASCGVARSAEFGLMIGDEHDRPLADGEIGELLIRPRLPWTVMTGYWKQPQDSLRAWRNGWLHTGDRFRRDVEGRYFFAGRGEDAIRRRGENISAAEIERAATSHPLVEEAAAVGIPSPHGEDEIKLSYRLSRSGGLAARDLAAHLEARLPAFMVPRYLEELAELPRTPTEKVRKSALRERGVHGAWDREAPAAARSRMRRA